jgi:hypothetical protein
MYDYELIGDLDLMLAKFNCLFEVLELKFKKVITF